MGEETEVTTIPQIRRVFRMAKVELDALAGLRDGALGYGTDTTILYRQNGDGAANWEAITTLGKSITTGTYTGDGGSDRQITTGFQCSMVILWNQTDAVAADTYIITFVSIFSFAGVSHTNDITLHATDGFTVGQTAADPTNENGDVYRYWAISV